MNSSHASNFFEWIVGDGLVIVVAVCSAVTWMYKLVGDAKAEAQRGRAEIWAAINSEKEKNQDFREEIWQKFGELTTKEDLRHTEDRIIKIIEMKAIRS